MTLACPLVGYIRSLAMGSLWVYNGCMVNFNLRLPDDLHEAIKAAAEREGRSRHGQILWYLRRAVENGERRSAQEA
ncbi:Arc family DNA-binding protein [Streptomyces sp. NBC_00019]|uniref:Arc family DNA-binding protein n=1 Tax=Streptomyces sp. NBC_00019 TaxID=2975623 RepID=UPI00386A4668